MSENTQTPDDDVRRIRIFDTTMRDGEQAPGCTMTRAEKLELGHQLANMGVDVVEAGYPAASPGDADAVRAVAEEVGGGSGPVICGLARATENDVLACAASVVPATRNRIHIFLATSDIHLKHKLRCSRDEVVKRGRESVSLAKSLVQEVEFSPEDAARTDPEYLLDVLAAVIECGATILNIPDTVGFTTPWEYENTIRRVVELAAQHPGVSVSTHCHDDLGLAVANTLAGIRAGARQVEVTLNGIGERAGNASLEEVVMALHTRPELFAGAHTRIDTTQLTRASRLLQQCTGMYVAPNKAIVGANAFSHEAGIHQDGVLKHRATYEIMTPESVGADGSMLVLGKHSGRHALRSRLAELGHELDDERFLEVFVRFKELCDRKKVVDDRDLTALASTAHDHAPARWTLQQLQVTSGTHLIPTSTVKLHAADGTTKIGSGTGDGPVDASCRAIDAVVGEFAELQGFTTRSVSEGTGALAEVTVRVKDFLTGRTFVGHGTNPDVVTASAEAYLDGVNRVLGARDAADAAESKVQYMFDSAKPARVSA
ncbi:MAG TPA: 2-isopropylmalate synthase [Gemmatimonadaceae bacterium]|nr:2-isopropylmalate synthase [Gemmatimonadaceae bacterium]